MIRRFSVVKNVVGGSESTSWAIYKDGEEWYGYIPKKWIAMQLVEKLNAEWDQGLDRRPAEYSKIAREAVQEEQETQSIIVTISIDLDINKGLQITDDELRAEIFAALDGTIERGGWWKFNDVNVDSVTENVD